MQQLAISKFREHAEVSGRLRKRAVVVGAGIGGQAMVGALAKHSEPVEILERNGLTATVSSRSGIPQERHPDTPTGGNSALRASVLIGVINSRKDRMIKRLLIDVAAIGLMTGIALAQGSPGKGSSTTTETTGPGGSTTTMTKEGTNWKGNSVTKQDAYKEGPAGSSETHSKSETDPASGSTTTSKTTTTKQ